MEGHRAAKVPQPDAPTVDHVIALARGGAHGEENWATAHQDGSSRLDPISDVYLSHLLQDLRDTWSDHYIWRTYFDGRRPASAQGTWLLTEHEDDDDHDDDDELWVRLDFGERQAAATRDHESPQRYRFSDALLVSHDGNGFELLALDGMPDEGWSSRFTPCSD
ncbi:HNH endonuclease [Micromonospora sp. B11E3]|uniref:HNH endonuclease n=1 Tax=Micromonospora sp. B11E3 TaxID=3153562 RepID=UPI00325D5B2F